MKLLNFLRRKLSDGSATTYVSDALPKLSSDQKPAEDIPLNDAWRRLTFSYGSDFSYIEGNSASFFVGVSENTNTVALENIPLLLSGFEDDRAQFQALKDNGVLLVCVPKEINFAPFSGPFTEQRDTPPCDRPALPIIAGGKKVFVTTKDEISTQDVIEGYNELIGVFEKALRAAAETSQSRLLIPVQHLIPK